MFNNLSFIYCIPSSFTSILNIYFIAPYIIILDAKNQAKGSANVKPYKALFFALILIGPPLIKRGTIKQIDVLATNSPIPARNGNSDIPIPCQEFLKINKTPNI